MRLDKFLKVSRIIKRRTIANEACDSDRVELNGRSAKAGTQVKIGDIVTLHFGDNNFKFRILAIPDVVKKDDATSLYEVLYEDECYNYMRR